MPCRAGQITSVRKLFKEFYSIFQINVQHRLFSLLSQPPVKFVNLVLGEQINCVCLGWELCSKKIFCPLPQAELWDVQSPHAPLSKQEPRGGLALRNIVGQH